jgi:hypothetical protein
MSRLQFAADFSGISAACITVTTGLTTNLCTALGINVLVIRITVSFANPLSLSLWETGYPLVEGEGLAFRNGRKQLARQIYTPPRILPAFPAGGGQLLAFRVPTVAMSETLRVCKAGQSDP